MMQKRMAAVFDSAGTLLNMYRAVKNIVTGEYDDKTFTTSLVAQKPDRGLVVLHTEPDKIMSCRPHKRICDFLQENNIKISLSCSSSPFTLKDVEAAIRHDTLTTMEDLHNVINIIKSKCPDVFYLGVGIIVDTSSASIIYTICTGGRPFNHTREALDRLNDLGVDTYIASGDSMRSLGNLARLVDIPMERVYDVATPEKKKWVIDNLKTQYEKVIMVGDGVNDILAFRAADKAVLSIQQTGTSSDRLLSEADVIIKDILEIVDIVEEMLQI